MKVGAFDYVQKPFKLGTLLPLLARAMDVRRLRCGNVHLQQTVAIYELTKTIAFTMDLDIGLNKCADAAVQQCHADEASVMVLTDQDASLYLYMAAVRGAGRQHLLGQRIPVGQEIAGWVALHGEPLLLNGQVKDPRFAPLYPRANIHSSILIPLLVGGRLLGIIGVSSVDTRRYFTPGDVTALNILASMIAPALQNARLYAQVRETEEHYRSIFENAGSLACAIAGELGLPEEQIEGLQVAAVLHDIGKIYVPAELLSKPRRLSDAEFNLVKAHPQVGYEILQSIEFPWPVAQVALQHHERLDGSGYPQGLKDDDILLEARILAVADVVEAMSSHRPYRAALGMDRALEELKSHQGTLYDAAVVDALLRTSIVFQICGADAG